MSSGSSLSSPKATRAARALASAGVLAYALLCCAACGATSEPTGGSHAKTSALATGAPSSSCAQSMATAYAEVAGRIYHQAASGRNVAQATHRVTTSRALIAAVRSGDAAATRTALRSLLLGQIVRIEVLRSGRVLASAGSGAAVAPVAGELPGTGGARYQLSVQSDHTYTQVTHQVTGAEVVLLSGSHPLDGTISLPGSVRVPDSGPLTIGPRSYEASTLAGSAYPSGPLRIAVLVPAAELSCPSDPAQTRSAVLGRVGERIYQAEESSPVVAATVRRMENTTAFKSAVASRDVAATRQAILGFFAAHIHVVRVRVLVGGKLLIDEGGPFALAPVSGTLRSGGRVIGTFVTAIQDDAGYLKLARLFTGAQVLMRVGSRQVMGTLSPGPAQVPDHGTVSYRGHSYQAFSFMATAFPSGPLRISLLY